MFTKLINSIIFVANRFGQRCGEIIYKVKANAAQSILERLKDAEHKTRALESELADLRGLREILLNNNILLDPQPTVDAGTHGDIVVERMRELSMAEKLECKKIVQSFLNELKAKYSASVKHHVHRLPGRLTDVLTGRIPTCSDIDGQSNGSAERSGLADRLNKDSMHAIIGVGGESAIGDTRGGSLRGDISRSGSTVERGSARSGIAIAQVNLALDSPLTHH